MKKLMTLFAVMFFMTASMAQTNWKVDPMHSSLNFKIKHSGISMVTGKFDKYEGGLTTKGEDLSDAKFSFTVDVNSINTSVEPRDKHLRSADFFEVEKYPSMKFESTKILKTGKKDHYLLFGNLTIKDVTKEVVFDLKHGGNQKSDKGEKIGFKATTEIDRFDYNINYDPGAAGIGKEVEITVHLQFAKQ